MKKAVVFGANGYIGRHLVYFLQQASLEVIPSDFQETSIDGHEKYACCDIASFNEVAVMDLDVDYVFVFAGMTGTAAGFEEYDEFIKANEIGLLNIIRQCMLQGTSARIVFPSTRLVYKGIKGKPLKEDSDLEAKTIYAQTKLSCEAYLEMYSNYYGLQYTTFRICVPYGNIFDESYSYGTIGYFLSKAKAGEDITLFGDGSLMRTFTHIEDICLSIIRAIQTDGSVNKVFNIGGEDLSLREAAEKIAGSYNVGIKYIDWPEEALKLESGDTIFNAEKLHSLIGSDYQYNLDSWIKIPRRHII